MIRAVLFDMDGLMVDTEPLQSRAFEQVLRRHGKQPIFTEAGIVQTVGLREADNWKHIKQKHGLTEPTDSLMRQRRAIYLEALKANVTPQPGLLELLRLLNRHKVRIAVASSSAVELIAVVLDTLRIRNYFDAVISGQDVRRGKPAPDIFLLAARRLRVRPQHCVVLEDAESGVRAAAAAGAKVIAVPNEFTKTHDYSLADITVASLEDVAWETLARL